MADVISSHADALAHARQLIDEGADIIDIGGESTRPGAADVPPDEEIRRVVPLLEALAASAVPLSVDTSKPEVMRAALAAGAAIINDVRALQWPGALEAVADSELRASADAHAGHAAHDATSTLLSRRDQ